MQIDKHHLLWSGSADGKQRFDGVGLVLNQLSAAALCTWHPVNDHILIAGLSTILGICQW